MILGIIIGLLISILIILMMIYLKNPIQKVANTIQKTVENTGPRSKGFIVEPRSESDISREEIIKRNKEQGRDTFLHELE